MTKIKKIQGIVVEAKPIDESRKFEGQEWRKYIFTLDKLKFSKRVKKERLPASLKGKKVKLIRYTLYDWHNKIGTKKTLTIEETNAVLNGNPIETVFW